MKQYFIFSLFSGRIIALVLLVVGGWKLVTHGLHWNAWEEVPAVVESVRIEKIPGVDHPNSEVIVRYRFTVAEKTYHSEQLDFFGRSGFVIGDPAEAERRVRELRADPPTSCRVHPTERDRSALFPTMELDFSIVMFSMGIVLSIACFWGFILRWVKREGDPVFVILIPMLSLALLFTTAIVALFTMQWWDEQRATDWEETPATIVASSMSYRDGWEPHIGFEWRGDDGEPHRSHVISFASFYGSVIEVERLLSTYEIGAETICYVDPADPLRAVLVRRMPLLNETVVASLLLVAAVWYGLFYYWRSRSNQAKREQRTPLERLIAWFDWKSPLAPLSIAFLYGAAPAILRECQLGVFPTMYQWLGFGSGAVILACGCILLLRWKGKRGRR